MEHEVKSNGQGEEEAPPPSEGKKTTEDCDNGTEQEDYLGCLASLYSCITPKSVLGLLIFLAMFLGFYFVIIFGYLEEFRIVVTSLGVGAYFIFVVIFIIAAQPFGEWRETNIFSGKVAKC